MPHWSGLLTTTEITQKASAYTTQTLGDQINYYVMLVKQVQDQGMSQRTIDVTGVVDINVERFFRLQLGYTVVHSTAGQPAGQTLLTKITW